MQQQQQQRNKKVFSSPRRERINKMPTLGTVDWTDGEVEFHTFFRHSTAAAASAACLYVRGVREFSS